VNIAEQLRTNLHGFREVAHLTPSELARRSGVSRAYIWQIEHGASIPTIEIIEQLARGLGLAIETLLGLDGKVPSIRLEEEQHAWLMRHQDADTLNYDTDGVCVQAIYLSPMRKARSEQA
jgi:transcriptional regulator with XRE-family HTH domain